MASIELREVTAENVRQVCGLKLAPGQEGFVAPAAYTLAEAQFDDEAFVKAIYAGDDLVGLAAVAADEDGWFLWRLMIDADHQRKGYGRQALERVFDLMRDRGVTEFLTSYVPGKGDPGPFYTAAGFEETGQVVHGERVLRRNL